MPLSPIGDAEFAALMAPFGPWGESAGGRHVAVAVSGGADSLALAWLARRWGVITALVVDHGLRAESAAEAAQSATLVRSWGADATVLRLSGLARGPGLAARARRARHAELQQACRTAGLPDLLLGHHAGDQAETLAMRRERGSGEAGLAGMAAVAEHSHARLLRPLLTVAPGRLRATLRAAGVAWAEDPGNQDVRTGRGRVRRALADPEGTGPAVCEALAASGEAGRRRAVRDREIARALAGCAIFPGLYAVIPDGPLPPDALASLLRGIAGSAYAVSSRQVARLAGALCAATLGGCRILPAGRLGPGWLVVREAAAMAAASPGAWDGRFRTGAGAPANSVLGPSARVSGRPPLPAAVRQTLPSLQHGAALAGTAYVAIRSRAVHELAPMIEPDCWPPAGAPFGVADTM